MIFCKASVFFKLLKKTIFQVPKFTHILILCGLEAVQACAKKIEPEKLFFSKTRFHPIRPYKGSRRKKKKRKGELQTLRIRSNLRIWQSYSRVPQILKVLIMCLVQLKIFSPPWIRALKFLYSEFLYNAQAVPMTSVCLYQNSLLAHVYMTIGST